MMGPIVVVVVADHHGDDDGHGDGIGRGTDDGHCRGGDGGGGDNDGRGHGCRHGYDDCTADLDGRRTMRRILSAPFRFHGFCVRERALTVSWRYIPSPLTVLASDPHIA